jgi:hypothetical protein
VLCKDPSWHSKVRGFSFIYNVALPYFTSGPARIGTADEEAREFTKFFGTIVDRDYHDAPELDSHLLLIPSNDRLNLIIATIGVLFYHSFFPSLLIIQQGAKFSVAAKSRSPSPDHVAELLEWAKNSARPPTSSAATSVKRKREPLTDDEQAWLTKKANEMEGFNAFQKHHNQRLTNSDRVKYWKFASNFCKANYKKYWPVGIERSVSKLLMVLT